MAQKRFGNTGKRNSIFENRSRSFIDILHTYSMEIVKDHAKYTFSGSLPTV